MKIVIAPDSFKGSLSATEAALSIEKGILKVFPESETFWIPLGECGERLKIRI
ncbi:glycerate kinase [Bacillus sp. JJ1521]|uniref:glycerate kinase n=1 Tax=Bacillus sp. JJ1521 TaxID=3122957 RepID=UPI002FFD8E0D